MLRQTQAFREFRWEQANKTAVGVFGPIDVVKTRYCFLWGRWVDSYPEKLILEPVGQFAKVGSF